MGTGDGVSVVALLGKGFSGRAATVGTAGDCGAAIDGKPVRSRRRLCGAKAHLAGTHAYVRHRAATVHTACRSSRVAVVGEAAVLPRSARRSHCHGPQGRCVAAGCEAGALARGACVARVGETAALPRAARQARCHDRRGALLCLAGSRIAVVGNTGALPWSTRQMRCCGRPDSRLARACEAGALPWLARQYLPCPSPAVAVTAPRAHVAVTTSHRVAVVLDSLRQPGSMARLCTVWRCTVSSTPRCGDLVPCDLVLCGIATSAYCHFEPPRTSHFEPAASHRRRESAASDRSGRTASGVCPESLAANTLYQPRAAVNPPL